MNEDKPFDDEQPGEVPDAPMALHNAVMNTLRRRIPTLSPTKADQTAQSVLRTVMIWYAAEAAKEAANG